jgi:hypothetical protein
MLAVLSRKYLQEPRIGGSLNKVEKLVGLIAMPARRRFEVGWNVPRSRHQLSPYAEQTLFGAGSKVRT